MTALKDILDEQARIRAELQRMEESEETTEENDGDLRDELVSRFQELDARAKPVIERMERIRGITRAAADPANLEGPGPGQNGNGNPYRGGNPELVIRNQRDPYEGLKEVTYFAGDKANGSHHLLLQRSEIMARCHDAVEFEAKRNGLEHDFAETAIRKAQGDKTIAEHILLTGCAEYQEAFRAYIENPKGMAQRAALSLTLANGGYLLPFVLDPTIILTNTGSANPWRRISNVKQTTSNTWNGVTSAGVNAAWLTEGSTTTDTTPTVGNVVVTPVKAAAWVN